MDVKKDIRRISKEFNLKFSDDWFDFMWITKRNIRFLEYVGMAWNREYNVFGKTIEKRISKIEEFNKSKELKNNLKRIGGQMITRLEVNKGIKDCKKIKDERLRKELLDLHNLIKKKMKGNHLALLTKTKSKKDKEFLMGEILKHEWLHELLFRNNINFGKINYEKYWKYDEGIVRYLEYYFSDKLNNLEKDRVKTKHPTAKIYYTYAIKFRKLLKNAKTPKERKKKILELKNKLNKVAL